MLDNAIQNELDELFELHPGIEAVTLLRRRVQGGTTVETEITIDHALRLETDTPHQALGDRSSESSVVTWIVLRSEANPDNVPPATGDVVRDSDEEEFTVRSIRRVALGRYELGCSQGRD